MFQYIDPLYWMLMAPVLLLSLWASFSVKRAFKKYSQLRSMSGMTGAQVARSILDQNGLSHITVEKHDGFLSDHYDPSKGAVRLSTQVYDNPSVASIGIAAHETGHAIQHAQKYAPLELRNLMVPVASIGSNMSWIIIMAGFFLGALGLIKIGIILFSVVVFFQFITLPVEFDASNRAKKLLTQYGMVSGQEGVAVAKVLNAAAMTYVAAAASAIATLLYFLLRSGLLGSRDD
jgi:Zn-dependent membrane protease YugP